MFANNQVYKKKPPQNPESLELFQEFNLAAVQELYVKVNPAKVLFRSTTIWEVLNRGDWFVVRLSDMVLTIVKPSEMVEA